MRVAGRAGVLMDARWAQQPCGASRRTARWAQQPCMASRRTAWWAQQLCRASHRTARWHLSRGGWAARPLCLDTGSCVPGTGRGEPRHAGVTSAASWLQPPGDDPPHHPLVNSPLKLLPLTVRSPCSCPTCSGCSLPGDAQNTRFRWQTAEPPHHRGSGAGGSTHGHRLGHHNGVTCRASPSPLPPGSAIKPSEGVGDRGGKGGDKGRENGDSPPARGERCRHPLVILHRQAGPCQSLRHASGAAACGKERARWVVAMAEGRREARLGPPPTSPPGTTTYRGASPRPPERDRAARPGPGHTAGWKAAPGRAGVQANPAGAGAGHGLGSPAACPGEREPDRGRADGRTGRAPWPPRRSSRLQRRAR